MTNYQITRTYRAQLVSEILAPDQASALQQFQDTREAPALAQAARYGLQLQADPGIALQFDAEGQAVTTPEAYLDAVGQRHGFADALGMADQVRQLRAVLADVAAMLPVAGRMHPKDLHDLQSRVIAARDLGGV